jgi:hypothetical protein
VVGDVHRDDGSERSSCTTTRRPFSSTCSRNGMVDTAPAVRPGCCSRMGRDRSSSARANRARAR